MAPADPTLDVARRDLCEALDRELHRLPDRLREPLVLCYLNDQTHDQAARQLGVHPRSLERRLQSGLSELQRRFGKRGVALSVAALMLLLSQQASAKVPAVLAAATAKAAVGTTAASAGAASLVAGGAGGGWALWGVGLSLVAAAALVGLTRGNGGDGPTAAPQPAANAAAEPNPAARRITVRGRVVDEANRPVAGATVRLLTRPVRRVPGSTVEALADPLATEKFRSGVFRLMARGTTDADGRFVMTGDVQIPDPTTGAGWFQSFPAVVKQPGRTLRVEDSEGEFGNMIWLPGVGIP